ncbi:MAG: glycosyltransferase family 1 protein [Nitrospiraceae bacterium]|nr:glycosyltransferase family 1 protein [Nitrospiraceae bacterium]
MKGIKVLVDGYNLELPAGSGAKAYGLGLLAALKSMGAGVGLLSSKKNVRSTPALEEALFFETSKAGGRIKLMPDALGKIAGYTHRSGLAGMAAGMAAGFTEIALELGKIESSFTSVVERVERALRLVREAPVALTRTFPRASEIRRAHTVVTRGLENEFLDSTSLYALHKCYSIANTRFRMGLGATKIAVPEKIAVWHATCPMPVRIRGAKMITTIHDVIPLKLPYATPDDKRTYYKLVKRSIRDSALVIAVSEHTKKDILSIFDADPEKVFVTYQPVDPAPRPNEAELTGFLSKYWLKKDRYLLCVGTIEPSRNIGRLLEAYALLGTYMPLVIVGRKGRLWTYGIGSKNMKNVMMLDNISRKELAYFYAGAYCLIHPSLYEGFGLPPVEAMSYGCPVITANVASLPEVCGSAALYADPYDVRALKNAVEELISNPEAREKFSEAGLKRARFFDMENYIKRLYNAYEKVL